MWERQIEAFSRSHFVIRCDLRGFGRSANPPAEFSHHTDIATLLDYLQIEVAHIVGASFGGAVSIDFALAYPQRVTSLVLAAPALGGYRFESAHMLDFFEAEEQALARNDIETAVELNLKMWLDGFGRQPGVVSREIREQVREMQRTIFSQMQGEHGEEKEWSPAAIDRLEQITCPTMVIVGEHDAPEFGSIADQIARRIPNATHVILPAVAHLPSMEEPEEFNRLVLEFLGKPTT